MRFPNAGGLATALGLGVSGYGQDVTTNLQRERQRLLDEQATQRLGMDQSLHNAQIGNYESEAKQRDAATAAAAVAAAGKAGANKRAFGLIAKMNPQHPMVAGGFDPDTDYTEEAKGVVGAWKEAQKPPKSQVIQTDQGLSRVLTEGAPGLIMGPDGKPLGKPVAQTTPYQNSMLDIYRSRIQQQKDAAAKKAAVPTPDQVKSQTVNDLAAPAADILIKYHGSGDEGPRRALAAGASHIPWIGHMMEGGIDENYQNAMNAARTLATQYLEIMPKSRFQPSTVDDIIKQIAPNVGDGPSLKASKIARVQTLKSAIANRAKLRPDAPSPDLNDIPEPPVGPP